MIFFGLDWEKNTSYGQKYFRKGTVSTAQTIHKCIILFPVYPSCITILLSHVGITAQNNFLDNPCKVKFGVDNLILVDMKGSLFLMISF